ncbi:D-alanyl-D-alanine carboxypeptidase family protein [Gloeocapsa sp. PCC 73106]|uniref:M15 family metallopeptidase n=1 Tax=Gloeocapsa sp. PCC 73106 TaxID=102232 RepID=UPI0002ACDCE6|nr:M15 family metallopeptidase [Gloeocapsa sp. PCC 73106]ELR96337.1 D-alanyl-D-alanine carboxypeptidase [Gloeocapsa sp. PCC 73106]
MEDIPKALREKSQPQKVSFSSPLLLVGGVFLSSLGVIALTFAFWPRPQQTETSVTPVPPPVPTVTPTPTPVEDNLLGHLSYEEAPPSDLIPITPDQQVKLRSAAAAKFLEMQADAASEGIILVPVSGFRSISEQEHLFFEVKAERGEVTTKRAEVSAPPGYSEHHTGYAIDIGDGKVPATHVKGDFAQTPAFKWLQANAARYSFELSFPENNPQGINYEPWHWRFVGDTHSLKTFYQARNLSNNE